MHKIVPESNDPYQLRADGSRTSVDDPDLARSVHAGALLNLQDPLKVLDYSSSTVLFVKSSEVNDILFPRGTISQPTGGQ